MSQAKRVKLAGIEQGSESVGAMSVGLEFAGARLGDARLEKRALAIVERLGASPAAPFPRALGSEADLEAFYRFLRNPATKFELVLEPHIAATVRRMEGSAEVLAVHDTTEFRFGGKRDGLGDLTTAGHGFLSHLTLAVTADEARAPLGVLGVEAWARSEPTATGLLKAGKVSYAAGRALPKEQDRWFRGVLAAEAEAGEASSLIHVMDSEADDYKLMANLVTTGRRWVIRLCHYDRRLADGPSKIRAVIASRKVAARRLVSLSRRQRKPGGHKRRRQRARAQRHATLALRAATITLRRPVYLRDLPETLTVNVVSVEEVDPPRGQEPVDWLLVTSEPVESTQQVLKVVDIYRARWRIEEFFKALKTGCAYEKRQLETSQTLLTALALFIPIAWSLLALRTLARRDAVAPAATILSPTQLEVLRRSSNNSLPRRPTAKQALMAIARLGGHHRTNGDPGWQLLGRGYHDLLLLVAGYLLAT
jgi:hypothetical protein